MSGYTAVCVSTCPNCATPGIKILDFPENISNPLNPRACRGNRQPRADVVELVSAVYPDNPNTFVSAGNAQDARKVFPTIYRSTRTAIPLNGVPTPIQDTYRKALTALDSPALGDWVTAAATLQILLTLF